MPALSHIRETPKTPAYQTPKLWLGHLFGAKAARGGGVVRRKLRGIERFVGLSAVQHEISRRGYTALINGADVVVCCNREPVRPLVETNYLEGIDTDFSKSPWR